MSESVPVAEDVRSEPRDFIRQSKELFVSDEYHSIEPAGRLINSRERLSAVANEGVLPRGRDVLPVAPDCRFLETRVEAALDLLKRFAMTFLHGLEECEPVRVLSPLGGAAAEPDEMEIPDANSRAMQMDEAVVKAVLIGQVAVPVAIYVKHRSLKGLEGFEECRRCRANVAGHHDRIEPTALSANHGLDSRHRTVNVREDE